MAEGDAIEKAISQFHGHPLDGRPLVVNEARPKPDGPPSFQRGGGRPQGVGQREPRW
jgi:RNA recognition motif-containing protein